MQGARNRAAGLLQQHPTSLVIAIEGGVGPHLGPAVDARQHDQRLECFAWVVVMQDGWDAAEARSASFLLPAAVSAAMLQEGMELGEADDKVCACATICQPLAFVTCELHQP
jgi:non-canonical (house-cleaning) NTP pyrophosphatase